MQGKDGWMEGVSWDIAVAPEVKMDDEGQATVERVSLCFKYTIKQASCQEAEIGDGAVND